MATLSSSIRESSTRVNTRSAPLSSAEIRQSLNRADANIALGPRLDRGNPSLWRVPSPCWTPEAVAEWKRLGGNVAGVDTLLPYWFIPRRAVSLQDLDKLYRKFYSVSIRDALMRLVFGDHELHEKVKRAIALRTQGDNNG